MRVRVDGTTYLGPAADLSGTAVDGETVTAAIRGERVGGVSVACLQPGPVAERVGHVRPGMCVQVRTALALAARSRGLAAPQDEQMRAIHDRLAGEERPAHPDLESARRRRAGTRERVERLRERVATVRGRLATAREVGGDVAELETELSAAVEALSEAETERAAASEALERARREARRERDRRERRRRLEEKRANLARTARAHLVDVLHDEFAAAVDAVPEHEAKGDPLGVDGVPAALAVCRVADLYAPVVLACDRFPDAGAAAEWLDAQVVRV